MKLCDNTTIKTTKGFKMNLTKITLSVALAGALTLGLADAPTQTTPTIDVDAQIAQIQNAPAEQRVQLMNEFKQQVASMNAEQRQEVIMQIQTKMQAANTNLNHEGQNHEQGYDQGAMSQATTMQQNTEMQRGQIEQMAQHQAGGQYMQEHGGDVHPPMESMPAGGNAPIGGDMQQYGGGGQPHVDNIPTGGNAPTGGNFQSHQNEGMPEGNTQQNFNQY